MHLGDAASAAISPSRWSPGLAGAVLERETRRHAPRGRDLLLDKATVAAAADEGDLPLQTYLDEAAERHIRGVLARHHGRRAEAARALGVERTTLYRLMKKFAIADE